MIKGECMITRRSVLSIALLSGFLLQAKPPVENYTLSWSDEFDGTKLDRAKWDYRQLGPRRDAVNVKETVQLDGKGRLVLTTRKKGSQYQTAMIGTQGKFECRFGYFECRVKLQTQRGHWSAFWLQSPTISKTGDVKKYGTEIDIFEYLVKNKTQILHNLHWDGYGKKHKHIGTKKQIPKLNEGFHTIGLLWTPEQYVFYVDGKETWRTTKAVSHRTQYIILSLEVGKWAGDIKTVKLPDHAIFDYVRVYRKTGS